MKFIRKALEKTHTIHWKEKTSSGAVERAYKVPKEHVEFHLNEMRKSKGVLYDVKVTQ